MVDKRIRFAVTWTPINVVKHFCSKAGWKENDGTSFWDWIDPVDGEQRAIFKNFEDALKAATNALKTDVFGQTSIDQLEFGYDPDFPNDPDLIDWHSTKSWHVDQEGLHTIST